MYCLCSMCLPYSQEVGDAILHSLDYSLTGHTDRIFLTTPYSKNANLM
jgi:hypothetical protein